MSQRIQGEGEIPLKDRRRGLARRLLYSTSLLLKLFSQNTSIIIPLVGITSLCLVMALGQSSCIRPRPGDPGDVCAGPSHCKVFRKSTRIVLLSSLLYRGLFFFWNVIVDVGKLSRVVVKVCECLLFWNVISEKRNVSKENPVFTINGN